MAKTIEITGVRSGLLVAIKPTGETKDNCVLWWCKCDCGGGRAAKASDIKNGRVKSCGCVPRGYDPDCVPSKNKPAQRKDMAICAATALLRKFNNEFSGGAKKYDKNDTTRLILPNLFIKKTPEQLGLDQAKLFIFSGDR